MPFWKECNAISWKLFIAIDEHFGNAILNLRKTILKKKGIRQGKEGQF